MTKPCSYCGRSVTKGKPARFKRTDGWYWHESCWRKFLTAADKARVRPGIGREPK